MMEPGIVAADLVAHGSSATNTRVHGEGRRYRQKLFAVDQHDIVDPFQSARSFAGVGALC